VILIVAIGIFPDLVFGATDGAVNNLVTNSFGG
jgi:hypothetical protein